MYYCEEFGNMHCDMQPSMKIVSQHTDRLILCSF
jgi:hypothetical protein